LLNIVGSLDKQLKGGFFDRWRNLQEEWYRLLSVIFAVGGDIVVFL